jgi:hypothetical protein
MVHRDSLVRLITLVVATVLPAQAQEIKNGMCPTGGTNDQYSVVSGSENIAGTDELSQFANRSGFSVPQFSPMLLNATAFGAGAVGTFSISGNYILRASIIGLTSSSGFGLAELNTEGVLMPIEFGLRIPLVHSVLGTMDYTLYGEGTAGLLVGMSVPTGGSFLSYSILNSRFSSGASAYLGIGNTLRFDRYVGIYLNGGAGYLDMFSSTFMTRSSYLYPSVSVGFLFSLAP